MADTKDMSRADKVAFNRGVDAQKRENRSDWVDLTLDQLRGSTSAPAGHEQAFKAGKASVKK